VAYEVTFPRQGWSVDEAVFVEWLKREGDIVQPGEPIFSVETEKAVQEVEAIDEGVLCIAPDSPKPGDTIRVGELVAYLLEEGETSPFAPTGHESKQNLSESKEQVVQDSHFHDRDGEVSSTTEHEPFAEETSGNTGPGNATPRARKRARQEGIPLSSVSGSGKGGRIHESDVIAMLSSESSKTERRESSSPSGMRRTIAERMMRSRNSTAAVTLTTRANADNLVALRSHFQRGAPTDVTSIPSYMDFVIYTVARMIQQHLILAARWKDDRLILPDRIDIGFAVDTVVGLVVPVVRDVPSLSLHALAQSTHDLAERARSRVLQPQELNGGVFSVTNLGAYGIDVFTPIINYPECAVLGIGRITREPVVVGESLGIRSMMWMSLTFDHRIVDGAPAARFLDALRKELESVSVPESH
jgi:pyruvate dehydrogenase E2 component (dihydrolipoamide acetyltransferase)